VHAEVEAHRLLDLGAMAHQHPRKRAQQRLTFLERGERLGQERRALGPTISCSSSMAASSLVVVPCSMVDMPVLL